MHRILFVCYGNICRSPMAECIMKELVKRRGLEDSFFIASCATSTEEIGNPVYPMARAELQKHGLSCHGKVSVHLKPEDYEAYDLLIAMDALNVRGILRIVGSDEEHKIHRMMEHTTSGGEVADPWYTRRFDVAYRDIYKGCESWLDAIVNK